MKIEVLSESGASLTILQRIAAGDVTAVAECIDVYGNQIWGLTRKYQNNFQDREDAVQ